jgi:hypothetical protein
MKNGEETEDWRDTEEQSIVAFYAFNQIRALK